MFWNITTLIINSIFCKLGKISFYSHLCSLVMIELFFFFRMLLRLICCLINSPYTLFTLQALLKIKKKTVQLIQNRITFEYCKAIIAQCLLNLVFLIIRKNKPFFLLYILQVNYIFFLFCIRIFFYIMINCSKFSRIFLN